MSVLDNQLNWRRVFQGDPAELKCTTTPDLTVAQPVVNKEDTHLSVLNTPDGTTAQPVAQISGVRGIWPPSNATRVNKSEYTSGVNYQIIYTVPDGQKLFISNCGLVSSLSIAASATCRMGVRNSDDVNKYWIFYHYYERVVGKADYDSFVPALEAVAGDDVYIQSTDGNIKIRGFVHGWLEDA